MTTCPPLVSGLTIIRNGLRLGYPFIESIRATLPICDEFVVVVGAGDDGTREAVEAIDDPKIRIVDTEWSPLVTPQKCVLAEQTSIGLHLCRGRWCLYMQGNEIVHEDSLPRLRALMETHADDASVEAMLLERLTFWADFDHVFAAYPRIFKFSTRIVRPHIGTYSIRDAMSFAVFDGYSTRGRYPRAIDTGEWLYRYASVRPLEVIVEKRRHAVHKQVAGATRDQDHFFTHWPRQYIRRFTGSHPAVMAERQAAFPSQYDLDDPRCRTRLTFEERRRLVETAWYHRFGYPRRRSNRYRLLGDYRPKPDRPR